MEKKIFSLAILVAASLIMAPSIAGADYYVAGDFNGWNAAGNLMTDMGGGIWQVSLSGISAGRHEFKVTSGDWSWNYPGPNSWLYAPASGDVTITFNTNTSISDGWSPTEYRLGLSPDFPGTWTAVGSFQGWNNADPATAMTPLGSGIYYLEQLLAPGNYAWKAVVTGTWDSISWDNRSVNTSNWGFSTDPLNQLVKFWVDAINGTVKIEVVESSTPVPEPASMLTFGAGLLGLFGFLRKRLFGK